MRACVLLCVSVYRCVFDWCIGVCVYTSDITVGVGAQVTTTMADLNTIVDLGVGCVGCGEGGLFHSCVIGV